jgi:hypothetical protein
LPHSLPTRLCLLYPLLTLQKSCFSIKAFRSFRFKVELIPWYIPFQRIRSTSRVISFHHSLHVAIHGADYYCWWDEIYWYVLLYTVDMIYMTDDV